MRSNRTYLVEVRLDTARWVRIVHTAMTADALVRQLRHRYGYRCTVQVERLTVRTVWRAVWAALRYRLKPALRHHIVQTTLQAHRYGIALPEMYAALARATHHPVWSFLTHLLLHGNTLSEVFREMGFPRTDVAILRCGEQGGALEESLVLLDRQYRTQEDIRGHVRALMHRQIWIGIAFIGALGMMQRVFLPVIDEVLQSMGTRLPAWVTWISVGIQWGLLSTLGAAGAAGLGVRMGWQRMVTLARRVLHSIPILRRVYTHLDWSTVYLHAAVLERVGRGSAAAWRDAAGLCRTARVRRICLAMAQYCEHSPMSAGGLDRMGFPEEDTVLITAAWHTGQLHTAYTHLAEIHRTRLAATVHAVGHHMEQALTLGIGILVAVLLIAAYQALFQTYRWG